MNLGDIPCVAVARYQTFHRVYMARWQDVLKFRSKNLFSGIEAVVFLFRRGCNRAAQNGIPNHSLN